MCPLSHYLSHVTSPMSHAPSVSDYCLLSIHSRPRVTILSSHLICAWGQGDTAAAAAAAAAAAELFNASALVHAAAAAAAATLEALHARA